MSAGPAQRQVDHRRHPADRAGEGGGRAAVAGRGPRHHLARARRGGDQGGLPGDGRPRQRHRRRWSRTCWSSSSPACPAPARSWARSSRPRSCSPSFMPGDKVDTLMEEIRGPAGRTMWDKLGNVNEAVLANYLKNEYPQTVAVVLSKIKSEHAARVLACAAGGLRAGMRACACCAWSRCSARSSTRSSRRCAPSSCPTWRAPPSATATR